MRQTGSDPICLILLKRMDYLTHNYCYWEQACFDLYEVELVVDHCLDVLVGTRSLIEVFDRCDAVDDTLVIKSLDLGLKIQVLLSLATAHYST